MHREPFIIRFVAFDIVIFFKKDNKLIEIVCHLIKLYFPLSRTQSKPAFGLTGVPLFNRFWNAFKMIFIQAFQKQPERTGEQIQSAAYAYVGYNKRGIEPLIAER